MLPQLTTPDGGSPVNVPPPPYFRPLVGTPRNVKLTRTSWINERKGMTEAQRNGLRYEDRVQVELCKLLPDYEVSPHVRFDDDSGSRSIVPDGLLSCAGRVTIVEIKIRHMPEAWWQLEKLYRPVLQVRRPGCPISVVEVCRSYDPATPFPTKIERLSSVADIATFSGSFGVLQWKL